MKRLYATIAVGCALAFASAAQAQQHIPVTKDATLPTDTTRTVTTSAGDVDLIYWRGPLGYQLRPGAPPIYCSAADVEDVQNVQIKTDLYKAGMITPEQAKALALCAVPGQIGSGEMNMSAGRPEYSISIIPTDKKTYSKVQIDAYTGEVLNSKQFGGLRGLAGFLRESMEHKENKQP